MALFRVFFEIFNVENITTSGQGSIRSLKVVPFDRLGMVSC